MSPSNRVCCPLAIEHVAWSFSPWVLLEECILVSEVFLVVSLSVVRALVRGRPVVLLEECMLGSSEDLSLAIRCPFAVDGEESVVGGWESVVEAYLTGTSMQMWRREEDLVPLPRGFMITEIGENVESKKIRMFC